METKKILAEKIRQLRTLKNKSQLECADEIGLSKTVLCDIEKERANPTLDTLERLAESFNVPVSFLLEQTEDTSTMITAKLLLSSLEVVKTLKPEHQTLVVRLFEQLVLMLKPGVDEVLLKKK